MSKPYVIASLASPRRQLYACLSGVHPAVFPAPVVPSPFPPIVNHRFSTIPVAASAGDFPNFPLSACKQPSPKHYIGPMAFRGICDGGSTDDAMERRRKSYKCGKNYVTLDDVETWPHYWEQNKKEFEDVPKTNISVKSELASKVSLWRGDITHLEIDAIVNAANSRLMGGAGVDGAIHSAAGRKLKEECATLGGCEVGNAKITKGYDLPSRHVIHTVGPMVRRGSLNQEDLENCYISSLDLVAAHNLRSVAFPCISTGVYGYPNEPAAKVALSTVRAWLERKSSFVDRVIFCLFLPEDVKCYKKHVSYYFPLNES